jgi:hypothetical protein
MQARKSPQSLATVTHHSSAHGRGAGVGRGRAVGLGLAVALGVAVAVTVAVAVGLGEGVGVGVGPAPETQYLPPVFRSPESPVPPQTIISLLVHTAV